MYIFVKKYSPHLRIIYLLNLLTLLGCSEQTKVCKDKIILKTTRTSMLQSKFVYVVASDGTGEVSCRLPKPLGDTPVWSPDNKWVLYSTQNNKRAEMESQIFVSSANEKHIQLTYEKDGAVKPIWSPDGRQIAYEMTKGISLLDVNCLYQNKECEFKPVFVAIGIEPDLPPVNNLLVYVYQNSSESSEIRVIDLKQPNSVIEITPTGVKYCQDPTWSQDGRTIAVACYRENSYDIYFINWESLQATNITNSPITMETNPEWCLDGTRIAFISDNDEDLGKCLVDECTVTSTSLYTMNIDGNNLTRITFRSDEDIIWFSWIP